MKTTCKNCDIALAEDYHFCPNCSQKTPLHRLSLHEVFHEMLHYFTHADKGFLVLIKELAVKNGLVAQEYIAGKRKKYFSPLNFFMIVAALNLIAMTADGDHEKHNILKEHPELSAMNKSTQQQYVAMYERQYKAVDFIKHHANKTILLGLPLMALLYWFFYRKQKYNFTEHLVACMYMYGFCTFVFVVLCLLNLLIKTDINLIFGICILLQLVYFSVFYVRFIGDGRKLKAFMSSLTVIVFMFVMTGVLVSLYMTGLFG